MRGTILSFSHAKALGKPLKGVARNLNTACEEQVPTPAHHELDEFFQQLETMMTSDHLRMHREDKAASGFKVPFEFVGPDFEDF